MNTNLVTTDADRRRIAVGKKLLDSEELESISKHDREFRSWLENQALPSMFRAGIWLLPISIVDTVDSRLAHYKTDRLDLIDSFIKVYDQQILAAKDSLGSLFDVEDYPSKDKMRSKFDVETQYVEFQDSAEPREGPQGNAGGGAGETCRR